MGKIIHVQGTGRIEFKDIALKKHKYDPDHKVAATLGTHPNDACILLDRSTLYIVEAGAKDCAYNILTTAISMTYWNHPSSYGNNIRTILVYCTGIETEDALKYIHDYINIDPQQENWSTGFRVLPINFNSRSMGNRRVSPREFGRMYDRILDNPLYIQGTLYAYEPIAILIDDIGSLDPMALAELAANCDIPIVAMSYRIPTDL